MTQTSITRDSVSDEALLILRNLRENSQVGRSNKLADVKSALESSVSLEFDSYFFFLRKYHYIAMDREAHLQLTDHGKQVIEGNEVDKFTSEVGEFFADQILGTEESVPNAEKAGNGAKEISGIGQIDEVDEALNELRADVPNYREGPPTDPPLPPASAGWRDRLQTKREPFLPLRSSPTRSGTYAEGSEGDTRYDKLDEIGSGPLGIVSRGRHRGLGVDVCIKELKDIFAYFSFLERADVLARLKREVCAQAQVRHPGIVAILDQNVDAPRAYVVTELFSGSLRGHLIQQNGAAVEVSLAVRLFLQLSYALKAAHAQGLTHHNLKPENVLFDSLGNARLSDFGLSRVIEVDQAKGMPQVFVSTGGMGYMPPELLARSTDAGAAADVYSAGILLYEMLTGQIPGRRASLPSEANSKAPQKLDSIFDKMTRDRIESRYPDFDAVLNDFYAAFSGGEYLGNGDLILRGSASRAPGES